MRKESVGRRLTRIFLVCMLILGSLVCVVGVREYSLTEQKFYKSYLESCLKLVTDSLEGVSMETLLEDGEGELYQTYARRLDVVREDMGLEYVYVYIPASDGESLKNIMTSGMSEEEEWKPGKNMQEKVPKEAQEVFRGGRDSAERVSDDEYGYVLTVYYPVYGQDGSIEAVAGADLNRQQLIEMFFFNNWGMLLLLFAGCVLILIILRVFNQRVVVRPLIRVADHMEHFVSGEREKGEFAKLEVHSADEVGAIAKAFNGMAGELEQYLGQVADMAAKEQRVETEMQIARRIQMESLPEPEVSVSDSYFAELYADIRPARAVGGDFYDFFPVSEEQFCAVIGDVSGKGVTAALFMMRAKTLIKDMAQREESPAAALHKANVELCARNDSNMFITVFLGMLDKKTGRFSYANAGHNPPYAGRESYLPLHMNRACPLGLFEDEDYVDEEIILKPSESVFFYTDGVTEAENGSREKFGDERMNRVLDRHAGESCQSVAEAMGQEVRSFADGTAQSDDITMLMLRWKGMPKDEDTIIVSADIAKLPKIRKRIAEKAGNGCLCLNQLYLAAEEIFVNIASYAYEGKGPDVEKVVEFTCRRTGQELEMVFADYGTPFNPFENKEPTPEDNLEGDTVGGWGIFLVRRVCDETEYYRDGNKNIFRMLKKIN